METPAVRFAGGLDGPRRVVVGAVEAGSVYMAPHPFVWELGSKPGDDPEGPHSIQFMTWRPGLRAVFLYPDDSEEVADGMGFQILTVVSVHKPGRFPPRVFYTRQWQDPRGRQFGKAGLRIKTLGAFKTLAGGWRHEFRMATGEEFAEHATVEMAKAASN